MPYRLATPQSRNLLIAHYHHNCKLFLFYGALGEIRTHDLRLRRATLYPAELQAHCLFARLKHSYECTRLARLLGASRPLVPDGTVLTDVVHLRSPNSRPSLIKSDTLSCLSYKHPVFLPFKRFSFFFSLTKRASLYTASSENASFLCTRLI